MLTVRHGGGATSPAEPEIAVAGRKLHHAAGHDPKVRKSTCPGGAICSDRPGRLAITAAPSRG